MEIILDPHSSDFRFQHPFNCVISGSSGYIKFIFIKS